MSRALRAAALALLVGLALAGRPGAAHAGPFTDDELIDGFVKTVFGEERPSASGSASARLIKKFTGPVHYHIVSTASVDRTRSLRAFMASLSDAVENLTLRETSDTAGAQMIVFLTDRADYRAVIRNTAWDGVDTAFLEENACSAVLAARRTGIEQANIYLVADESFLALSHCMVEEVAQSLGPANDSSDLVDSIFNDDSDLNVFGIFDWFILSMLYHPAVQPGMTEAEVRPVLPSVIEDVSRRLPSVLGQDTDDLSHHTAASR